MSSPLLDRNLFNEGLRTVYAASQAHRVGDLLSEHDWGHLNQEVLDSGIVVGSNAIIRGYGRDVTHALHLRLYGEGSASNNANSAGILTDIRVYAAEGKHDDHVIDKQSYRFQKGMGTLTGMVIFNASGMVDADFAHGTGPSSNPAVNQRMGEILDTFGLPQTILGPENSKQYFNYDDAAMLGLIRNLPFAHEL